MREVARASATKEGGLEKGLQPPSEQGQKIAGVLGKSCGGGNNLTTELSMQRTAEDPSGRRNRTMEQGECTSEMGYKVLGMAAAWHVGIGWQVVSQEN